MERIEPPLPIIPKTNPTTKKAPIYPKMCNISKINQISSSVNIKLIFKTLIIILNIFVFQLCICEIKFFHFLLFIQFSFSQDFNIKKIEIKSLDTNNIDDNSFSSLTNFLQKD